jgi:hypothetical protein
MPFREPAALAERVAKYEASLARLEAIRGEYIRKKPIYLRAFVAMTLAGIACFAFGVFPGIWATLSTAFVGVTGYKMVKIRINELKSEIQNVREDIERLRATASG